MDRSKEINFRKKSTKLAYNIYAPLSMPVYFEDEEPPKQYGVKPQMGSNSFNASNKDRKKEIRVNL